jgi:hypothetical protein
LISGIRRRLKNRKRGEIKEGREVFLKVIKVTQGCLFTYTDRFPFLTNWITDSVGVLGISNHL